MIQIAELVWNERNIAHIARHNILPDEVEELVYGHDYAIRETYGNRYFLTGKTQAGRLISAILSLQREQTYYVVTARSADKKERVWYQSVKRGGEQAA